MNKESHPLNLRIPIVVYKALTILAKDNGTNVAIEARKGIVKRLQEKGKLNKGERYL